MSLFFNLEWSSMQFSCENASEGDPANTDGVRINQPLSLKDNMYKNIVFATGKSKQKLFRHLNFIGDQ